MLLERIATLKAEAKKAGEAGNWQQALDGYLEACTMLSGEEGADGGEEGGGVQAAAAGVAKELQSTPQRRPVRPSDPAVENVAIRLCGEALRANPRSATAHHRRAIALQGEGIRTRRSGTCVAPRSCSLRRSASVRAGQGREDHRLAPQDAEPPPRRLWRCRRRHGRDDAADAERRLGGAAADGLAGLFGGMGGVGGAGRRHEQHAVDAGGERRGAGAKGGRAADDDASPLEALLNSPLLAASGIGGKGAGKMIGTITTVLAYQRRAKKLCIACSNLTSRCSSGSSSSGTQGRTSSHTSCLSSAPTYPNGRSRASSPSVRPEPAVRRWPRPPQRRRQSSCDDVCLEFHSSARVQLGLCGGGGCTSAFWRPSRTLVLATDSRRSIHQ